ncbi:MAG: hypothetical protein LBJ31_01780 [Treponema sp.]|jgi:hypothetical protein|nr:hypothetical protein [Treponema sp.]
MKKLVLALTVFSVGAALCGAQIFYCVIETKQGSMGLSLHYTAYGDYTCILYTQETAFFLDEERVDTLRNIFIKWIEWEAIVLDEQVSLSKLVDVLEIDEYRYHNEFTKIPVSLYFVFNGAPPLFTLYVHVDGEVIGDFSLSKKQIEDFLDALTTEHLDAARSEYDREQRLLEMLN